MMPTRSAGRVAYEAYGDYRGWTTVHEEKMPDWHEQSEALRIGWEASALAVLAVYAGVDAMKNAANNGRLLGEVSEGVAEN